MSLNALCGLDKDFFGNLGFIIPNATITTKDNIVIDLIAAKDGIMIGMTEYISFSYRDITPLVVRFATIFPDSVLAAMINGTPRWFKRIDGQFYVLRPSDIYGLKNQIQERTLKLKTKTIVNTWFRLKGLTIEFSEGQ